MSHLATADSDRGLRRAAARALPRQRPTRCRSWRRTSANSAAALRCPPRGSGRALRRRALRALAVRDRSGRGRPRARALVAQRAGAGEAPRRRREHRLRAPFRRRAADLDRARARSATRTASGAISPARRCWSTGSDAGSSGTVSMDSFAVELPGQLPRGTPVTIVGDGVLVEEHARVAGTINYELTTGIRHSPERTRGCSSMADLVTELAEALAGAGGLARRRRAARRAARAPRGRPRRRLPRARSVRLARSRALAAGRRFPLSERHGAWRIALEDGRTVDFTPLPGGRSRRTSPAGTSRSTRWPVRSRAASSSIRSAGGATSAERTIRAVSRGVFEADPLRLLRAVRLEDELGFRIDAEAEALVRRHAELASQPAGERILGELERLSAAGYRRLAELGLLDAARRLGGAVRPDRPRRLTRVPARVRVRGAGCGGCRSRAASTGTAARCSPPSRRPTLHRVRSTASGARPSRGRSTRSPS